jgi:hypothetical protein
VSPSPNWSPQGRTAKDLSIRHVRAPQSAFEVHGFKAWQPFPGIGHPLSLHFLMAPRHRSLHRDSRSIPPPKAYGSCRIYGKRARRPSHRSLDGRPAGAAHRLHRPGDESSPRITKREGRSRDHIKDSEKVRMTALPLPRARRTTGRGRKTKRARLVNGQV